MGDSLRPARFDHLTNNRRPDGNYADIRFIYQVLTYDHDADGITIPPDAIQLEGGAQIVSYETGLPVDIDLEGFFFENDEFHKVRATIPDPPSRNCALDRREVYRHPAGFILDEWDGRTPIRVDMVDNFPSFITDEDLEDLLAPIGELADDIEAQLGYRILEMGEVIPVPRGARSGWDKDYHAYGPGLLPRDKGQLLAFYMDDDSSFWDHRGGAPMVAFTDTGSTSYNRRTMGDWWQDTDECCIGRWSANGRHGQVLVHEVFHLLGFEHPDVPFGTPGVRMAWGSTVVPWVSGSRVHYASEKDIEVLQCLFPRR